MTTPIPKATPPITQEEVDSLTETQKQQKTAAYDEDIRRYRKEIEFYVKARDRDASSIAKLDPQSPTAKSLQNRIKISEERIAFFGASIESSIRSKALLIESIESEPRRNTSVVVTGTAAKSNFPLNQSPPDPNFLQSQILPRTPNVTQPSPLGPNQVYGPPLVIASKKEESLVAKESKPNTPEAKLPSANWGVKLKTSTETFYLMLLPSISGSLNGTGHMDVPGSMPGISFKFQSSYAKHKIPGWAPVYQALGIDSVLVTIVGMFTGEDGNQLTPEQAERGGVIDVTPKNAFSSFPKSTEKSIELTNKLDTYQNLQSFVNFAAGRMQRLNVEININKSPNINPTSKVIGAIRGENGNPNFTGILRSLDTFYRRYDRTYYTMTIEITDGLVAASCANKPLNLTNRIDQVIKKQLESSRNQCGTVRDQAAKPASTPEEKKKNDEEALKDIPKACTSYSSNGNTENIFWIDGDKKLIRTYELTKSTNGEILTTKFIKDLKDKEAFNFVIDNSSNIKLRKEKPCTSEGFKNSEEAFKYLLENFKLSPKTPNLTLEKLTIDKEVIALRNGRRYATTKEGYLVELNSFKLGSLIPPKIIRIVNNPEEISAILLNIAFPDIETTRAYINNPNLILNK